MELRHTLHVEMGELELKKENIPEIEDMVSACARFVNVEKNKATLTAFSITQPKNISSEERTRWFPDAQRDIKRTFVTCLSFDSWKRFAISRNHHDFLTTAPSALYRKPP